MFSLFIAVTTYLDLLGAYSEDQFEMTYYEHNGQENDDGLILEMYPNEGSLPYIQGREEFFHETYSTGNGTINGRRPVSGASYIEIDDRSESSTEGSTAAVPPALPIKRRSSSSVSPVSDVQESLSYISISNLAILNFEIIII